MGTPDSTSSVFTDFCQAWGARFPGSELPDAWEEDVRANLKKHRTKVSILREELEKEEMYVDYLQTLLKDIESKKSATRHSTKGDTSKVDVDDLDANKQAFLDSHLNELQKTDAFVTVINVSNNDANETDLEHHHQGSSSILRPKKKTSVEHSHAIAHSSASASEIGIKNRDSIRSVSSPTTPTSPLISSSTEDFIGTREGLAAVNTSSISSSSDDSGKEPIEDLEAEEDQSNDGSYRGQPDGRDDEENLHKVTPASTLNKTTIIGKIDNNDPTSASNRASSVSQLRANWEGRPPVMLKPMAKSRSKLPLPPQEAGAAVQSSLHPSGSSREPPGRKDSDSSSRGRMGSPSGKSHDSSDSEHSWSRQDSGKKRSGATGSSSAETRLDRLVRKTSSGSRDDHPVNTNDSHPSKSVGGGIGIKKPQIKPRIISDNANEPLYDTVAADEDDEVYDNHLLYEKSKTDTIGSGGNR